MESEDLIALWDAEAKTFDDPADHGLQDPVVREAWRQLLLNLLPHAPARVADLGCGTGSLAVLLADEGFIVDAIDFSPEMVLRAELKGAARTGLRFMQADAFEPPLRAAAYDVVLCRHVLWCMPDASMALERWSRLLCPEGVLVLVEGRWSNDVGLTSEEAVALVEGLGRDAQLVPLSHAAYWGRPISDERYVVVSHGM